MIFHCPYRNWQGVLQCVLFSVATIGIASTVAAQQLIPKTTGPQCAAMGGRILTWTNTAGRGVEVGECLVPPNGGGGGGGRNVAPPPPSVDPAAVAGAIGAFGNLLDILGSTAGGAGEGQPSSMPPSTNRERDPRAGAGNMDPMARAERLFSRGAQENQNRAPCKATQLFLAAARYFAAAGDTGHRKEALFQASFAQAECDDATATAEAPTGDEQYVYYCPPEENVYDLTRKGSYVRPGEGCGNKRAQRLPRPTADAGDDKYVYYCPPENNVYDLTRKGRYVLPGEGCGDKRAQRLPRP